MRRVLNLYQTSVGRKVVMALTGIVLFGFVLVHMLGNLKIFTGEAHFNDYAVFLRSVGTPVIPPGGLLWVARLVLAFCVVAHIDAAVRVWLQSRRARSGRYLKNEDLSFSYASRTMRWGGMIVLAFVAYHVLHLTLGVVHPEFIGADHPLAYEHHVNAYRNVVAGFRVPWVSVAYVLAMIPLGLHIYHGLWSATQSLALQNPRITRWRRPVAAGIALLISLGNISVPLSVLAGLVR